MDLAVENDKLLEMNKMELRSGRNLVKCSAVSTELAGTTATPKENVQTPRRKSVASKRSLGKEKENEEPVDESRSRKSTQRKTNKRKSKLEEENEVDETSPLAENAETPSRTTSQTKKRRKTIQSVYDHLGTSTTSTENVQTPTRKSINIKRSIAKEKENEDPGTSTTSTENVQTPTRKSINIKRSIAKEKENEDPATTCLSIEGSENRKSSQRKMNKRKDKLEEEYEMAMTSTSVEESSGTKSTQRKINKKKGKLEEENEVAETSSLVENARSPNRKSSQMKERRKSMQILQEQSTENSSLVENAQSPNRKSSQMKERKKSMQILQEQPIETSSSVKESPGRKESRAKMNRRKSMGDEQHEVEFSDLVRTSQECEIVTENFETNGELSVPTNDQIEEDVAEILNSTFEVVEEDFSLQTPARKRSVRFADAVETRRQSASVDSSPKFSTPVSVNSKQRSSQHKGTPHPSAKKRPASILRNSSSKKFPSSSKDKSLRGTGSVRKMPDFSSIHKAQFEKMESIVDFSHRRHKCVRKLETQAADESNKQVQSKPAAVVKPMEQTTRNALSQIPAASQNTSRSGTPRALSSSRIPLASFRVLTEKNFDARRSTPHTTKSRPSLKNFDARRSTPHTTKSRPSLKNFDARRNTPQAINSRPSLKNFDASRSTPQAINSRSSNTKIGNDSRLKPVNNPKPQRITYEQAKATIQNKKPLAVVKREAERQENRNILKGVRLNRRFELQMQHRKINM